ncbi:acyl-CoA dehydrogenase family protein [Microbacterium sp. STN6]|uniref:acyl-CoA dehydrogenase family protein n=1 Tax=Microbacterium sp. STN6 TaxID=2995588 RepID=UPI00226085B2|nr:acyl-CoA dehydrogenase family protein [Microbacterium sp. STN6]MCX7523289.1 acyl-CoA dehydrogenase family protein [Microbacterium sp. STN6]
MKSDAYGERLYDADLYDFARVLPGTERDALRRLRAVLDQRVAPLLASSWERGEFPREIIEPLVSLDLMDPNRDSGRVSPLYAGFRNFELARTDASIATFYNAQSGLFRTAVALGGSPGQAQEWDPLIRRWELTAAFALTEPNHGSDIARGLSTTCRRAGDTWTIDGRKRWIGAADTAANLLVFARDAADGEVKAFLVPRDADGVSLTRIEGKTSLRIMQNFDIELTAVTVDDHWRLGGISSFADVSACLRAMRSDVAWIATGAACGAFEAARRYVLDREQFSSSLAGFQLVQEKLALMAADVTASLALVTKLSQQQAEGIWRDENSALAKMFTARALRTTAALARELCGGNGITLETDVARFHADAEAIYSYEGTQDINALILGRALTGYSAFTRTPLRGAAAASAAS